MKHSTQGIKLSNKFWSVLAVVESNLTSVHSLSLIEDVMYFFIDLERNHLCLGFELH